MRLTASEVGGERASTGMPRFRSLSRRHGNTIISHFNEEVKFFLAKAPKPKDLGFFCFFVDKVFYHLINILTYFANYVKFFIKNFATR